MKEHIGALLHSKWKRGFKAGEIEGYWAEDMHPFTITCPEQLVDILIEMQNWLSEKYCLIYILKSKLNLAESFFEAKTNEVT